MSRVHSNQKFFRMIKFLRSVKHPYVARALGSVGFDDQEFQRGWDLFRQAMGPDLLPADSGPRSDEAFRELIRRIDRWENRSFDVADATLRHFYPEVHERLFRNIAKTSGPEVIFTVGTFLRRLDELEQEGGRENTEALALLARRRVDSASRREAQGLIDEATRLSEAEQEAARRDAQAAQERRLSEVERKRAEDAMWQWFKDWAQIARTLVTDKRYRYLMGVSQPPQGAADAAELPVGPPPPVSSSPGPPSTPPVPVTA